MQAMQPDASDAPAIEYVPAAQPVHEVEPVFTWKAPAEQLEQLDDSDAPTVARYFPAAQSTQDVAPVAGW